MNKAFVDTSVILRILLQDDELKRKAAEKLLRDSKKGGETLFLLPVAVMEVVWVLEKVYKFSKSKVREIVEAILNTPDLKVEMEEVFLRAIRDYAENNIKFADALMAHWGIAQGLNTVYTFDAKHFKRVDGLTVKVPA